MVFKRKEGKYWYIYWYKNGKKYHRSSGTTNPKMAEKIIRDLEDKLAADKFNIDHIDKKMMLADFWKEAILHSHTNKSENTSLIDNTAFRHLSGFTGNVSLNSINPQLIEFFKLHLKEEVNLNATTINMYLRHLSSSFSLAVKYKYINENPFKGVKKLPTDEKMPVFLSHTQAKALLNYTKNKNIHQYIMIALYTGARISEVCSLKWEDIYFDQGKIKLTGKGRKERIIPIPQKLIQFLNGKQKRGGYVVTGTRDRREVTRQFREYADKIPGADLKKFTFHNLRDTYASWLAQKGTPILVIQKLLGHKSIKTTMIYSHLSPENLISAIDDFM